MIVVDTSALIAMTFGEPTAPALRLRLASESERYMSAANAVEFGTVVAGRSTAPKDDAQESVWRMLAEIGIQAAPVDEAQARIALDARIRFGKGFGTKAGLNFGDSFSYALSKSLNAPLLFVGDDFRHTDVLAAL
jgi:ribonuclease VapC